VVTETVAPRPGARALRQLSDATADTTRPASSARFDALEAALPIVSRDAYAIGPQVARGGIGRILSARDRRLDRPVAIKELLVRDAALERRFIREALLTARLQHPAIVPVYEAGRWPDGEPFYAMKLVSGRNLAELIAERPTLEERLALLPHVRTVAQAVAYAHGQHVLHRDLKPANVIVGELGETVVIDWGIAKDLTEEDAAVSPGPGAADEGATMVGAVIGTPSYMPPEQALGKAVDERADIYAIGAMLYHLIAAAPPYRDVSASGLLATIGAVPPRPVEDHAPTLALELSAIVHKAMARDPAARYPTAKALADDLVRFETGQMVGAHHYSTGELARRFWRRHRAAISSAAAACVLMAAVVVFALVKTDASRRRALAHKAEAERAGEVAEAAGRQATARADELTLLQAESASARDPDEAIAWLKTLSPSATDAEAVRRIAADALARGLSRVYRGHGAFINDILVLDGGRRFVTASDDRTLRVWDVATGSSRVLEGHTDEAWRAVAFPAGDRIVSCSKDGTARIWQLETGALLATVALPGPAHELAVRADGAVVGKGQAAPWTPWVLPPGASEVRLLSDPTEVLAASQISADGRRVVIETKEGAVFVVDTETGRRRALGTASGRGHWYLSEDGRTAVRTVPSPHGPCEHTAWNLETGVRHTVVTPGVWYWAVLSPRGDLAAFGTEERVEIVDARSGALVRRYPGPSSEPRFAVFSGDGRILALGSDDRTVRTWDLTTNEGRVYPGLSGAVGRIAFLPDQRAFLAGSATGEVRLFKPATAGVVLSDTRTRALALAVSGEGRVASLDAEGHLRIVSLSGEAIADHALGPASSAVLLTSPDQRRFAAAAIPCAGYALCPPGEKSGHPFIAIGAFGGARPLLVAMPAAVRALAWRAESDGVFVALADGAVEKVTLDGLTTEIERLPAPVASLAVSGDGQLLAMGGDDGLVRVADLTAGTRRDLGRHGARVAALAFAKGAGLLASGSGDHTARLWRLTDGSYRPLVASGGFLQLAFSARDEVVLAVGEREMLLRRWSVASGAELPPLAAHQGSITSLSISSDGRRMLTGSVDRSARLFDLESGKSRELPGRSGAVVATAFAAGGKILVTLGAEGVVRAWPDDLPEGMAELRAFLETATLDRVEGR